MIPGEGPGEAAPPRRGRDWVRQSFETGNDFISESLLRAGSRQGLGAEED